MSFVQSEVKDIFSCLNKLWYTSFLPKEHIIATFK